MVSETEQTNPQSESIIGSVADKAAASLTSQEAEVVKSAIIPNEKVVLPLTLQAKLAKAQEIELAASNNATSARAIAEDKKAAAVDLRGHNSATKAELYNQLVATASNYQSFIKNSSKAEAEAFNGFKVAESTALDLEDLASAARSVREAQEAAINADQATITAITLQQEAEAERVAYEQKLQQADAAGRLARDAKKNATLAQDSLDHSPHVTKLLNAVDDKTVISTIAVQDIIDKNIAVKAQEDAQARILVSKLMDELDKSGEAEENASIAQGVLDKANPVSSISDEDATVAAIVDNAGEVHLGGEAHLIDDF